MGNSDPSNPHQNKSERMRHKRPLFYFYPFNINMNELGIINSDHQICWLNKYIFYNSVPARKSRLKEPTDSASTNPWMGPSENGRWLWSLVDGAPMKSV